MRNKYNTYFNAFVTLLLSLILILCGCSSGGTTNYISTVQNHTLFVDCTGITLKDVTDSHIASSSWSHRYSNGVNYVKVSGTLEGYDQSFATEFSVYNDENDINTVYIYVDSMYIDGTAATDEEATNILYDMFNSYKNGYSSLYDWYAANDTTTNTNTGNNIPQLGYGFEWVEMPSVQTTEYGGTIITGVVKNMSGSTKTASITFCCYDEAGYQVDTPIAITSSLSNGKSWRFEAHITDRSAVTWEFSEFSAF